MKLINSIGVVVAVVALTSCNSKNYTNKALKTEIDSVSYAIGVDVARNINMSMSEVDKDLLIQGILNGSDSTSTKLIAQDQCQTVIQSYFQKKQADMMQKQADEMKKQEEDNAKNFEAYKAEGEKFIAETAKKPGVKTTASGLEYEVIKEGKGKTPTATSNVKVHYHGTLPDGTVFDSSVDRGEPTEFGVSQVIKGWTEGLQLMKEGSKYKFYIPQELAYGAQQRGEKIKPYSPLVFEVELLEVKN